MASHVLRPDNRPNEVVWHWVEKALSEHDFAPVSWALGSDWGSGMRILTAAEYKAEVYKRMEIIYGKRPT